MSEGRLMSMVPLGGWFGRAGESVLQRREEEKGSTDRPPAQGCPVRRGMQLAGGAMENGGRARRVDGGPGSFTPGPPRVPDHDRRIRPAVRGAATHRRRARG